MSATTPGQVKNIIRRSLREVVDPSPSKADVKKIWEFFDSKCVYCGKGLHKEKKEGHIDHLVSSSCSGSNQITNRVLSCATCNEKEKLAGPWEEFLVSKNSDEKVREQRKQKISDWQKLHKRVVLSKKVLTEIQELGDEVAAYYDEKIQRARALKKY